MWQSGKRKDISGNWEQEREERYSRQEKEKKRNEKSGKLKRNMVEGKKECCKCHFNRGNI